MTIHEQLVESAKFLSAPKIKPKVGFVLGSGLSFFGRSIDVSAQWSFAEIPHFCPPSVTGHPGQLLFGRLSGVPVAVLQGRLHAYEGHSFQDVVFPVRLLSQLGVQILIVTNAAGGLLPKMKPGDFMLINDQINLTGNNPLIGPNVAELGERFTDMTEAYDPRLRQLMKKVLRKQRVRYHEGVYCGVLGPSYETAAEIRFLKKIGGGAVGMSTVAEVIAARHAGMRVAGLSCITNLGTGLSRHKLSHEEVKTVANQVEESFSAVLRDFTLCLAEEVK